MPTQIAIPVDLERFLELVEFLRESGSKRDPVEVVDMAISYWMDNASWKPEVLMPEVSETHGFLWRHNKRTLFLPDGTEIRMRYKGEYHYAKVQGDDIRYQGKPITPGALTKAITGTSRNAWRDIWIKRPKDSSWQLADEAQRAEEKEIRNLFA